MKNLLEMAINATEQNLVKKTSKKSINDMLVKLLFDEKKVLTKLQIIGHISYDRLLKSNDEKELEKLSKDDLFKLLKPIQITVKNGFEASVCNGQNNASFSYNKKYDKYELIKNNDDTFTIKLKK